MIFEKFSILPENKKSLLFLLCLSAVIKVIFALSNNLINPDGILYISAAKQFALGHFSEGLALYPMPFYPFLIAIVHSVIPHWVAATKFISITTSVFTLIPLYLLANDLFDRKAAFWACLAFTLVPFANECSIQAIRGPSFLFLFAWAVYFAQRAIVTKRWTFFLMATLFPWLSALFRVEGIIIVPLYLLFLVCLAILRPQERNDFLKGITVWIVFSLLVLAAFFWALGPVLNSFVGVDQIIQKLRDFLHLKFLDTYHQIYSQLKAMEATSPFPGGKQNLAEIARNFMPVVYLMGLFQILIKILFFPFAVPLIFGFRHSLSRSRIFVLALVIFYLFMVYYTLIEKDFIQSRFLFAPAVLLYPWIGAGMCRIFTFFSRFLRKQLFSTILVVLFVSLPAYKCMPLICNHDNVIGMAGEWLANDSRFFNATMICNDSRIPFYAGTKTDIIRYHRKHHDYSAMEQIAIDRKIQLIIIRISIKKQRLIPDFATYKKVVEFTGTKNIVVIFSSPEFQKEMYHKE